MTEHPGRADLRRLPRNWLVGIRTRSTMASATAWADSHAAAAGELTAARAVRVARSAPPDRDA